MGLNKNWNGIKDSELEEIAEKSESDTAYRDSMIELQKANQKMKNHAELCRIKSGNAIMNYITEYLLEQERYYKERYKTNYIEAMRGDRVWIIECDEKFNELMRDYFENTIGD